MWRLDGPWAGIVVAVVVVLVAASGYLGWRTIDLSSDLEEMGSEVRAATASAGASKRLLRNLRRVSSADHKLLRAVSKEVGGLEEAANQTSERVKNLEASSVDVPALIEETKDSVVTIYAGEASGAGFAIEVRDYPSGFQTAIITAQHVIESANDGAARVYVGRGDERIAAELWSADAASDLALLFVAADIPTLPWASDNNHEVRTGEAVLAIGSPFGLEGNATTGRVSKLEADHIVVDAPINPGNSGGPLLNQFGEVLGVNVSKIDPTLGENIGFAVKIERACLDILDC